MTDGLEAFMRDLKNQGAVIDSPFMEYVHNVPGIVVLRARQDSQAGQDASAAKAGTQALQHQARSPAQG